jgi:hypothetical protein
LATYDETIDKEKDYRADYTTNETGRLSGLIPSNSLSEVSRNERAYDSQNDRQNEAFRLGLVARHNELGNHSNDKANNDCPKDAHLIAPVLSQTLGIDELVCDSSRQSCFDADQRRCAVWSPSFD